jgi:hypothetical protein
MLIQFLGSVSIGIGRLFKMIPRHFLAIQTWNQDHKHPGAMARMKLHIRQRVAKVVWPLTLAQKSRHGEPPRQLFETLAPALKGTVGHTVLQSKPLRFVLGEKGWWQLEVVPTTNVSIFFIPAPVLHWLPSQYLLR